MGKFQPTLKGEKAPRNTGIKRKVIAKKQI
jgi:hypothetical protein